MFLCKEIVCLLSCLSRLRRVARQASTYRNKVKFPIFSISQLACVKALTRGEGGSLMIHTAFKYSRNPHQVFNICCYLLSAHYLCFYVPLKRTSCGKDSLGCMFWVVKKEKRQYNEKKRRFEEDSLEKMSEEWEWQRINLGEQKKNQSMKKQKDPGLVQSSKN